MKLVFFRRNIFLELNFKRTLSSHLGFAERIIENENYEIQKASGKFRKLPTPNRSALYLKHHTQLFSVLFF